VAGDLSLQGMKFSCLLYLSFEDQGRREGTATLTWASEAKEMVVEVVATEPQGSLRGSRSLGSL
jgi:hypothetical protein